MTKRTCFVVSPIGEEGGPVRKNADDVFDLLIQPALEKYGIEAIRADHIAGTGSITNDVIRHIQESDLCIIDLSGKNPNVYYECGRRHETGKPFIQIISKDEDIPFDIADIRTIKYELKDPREVRNAAVKIQSFVEGIIGKGFTATTGTTSMATLLDALNRIDRRLVNLESGNSAISTSLESNGSFLSLKDNPLKAFQEAYIRGDFAAIVNLLPRLEAVMPPGNFISAAGVVALQGGKAGHAALLRTLERSFDVLEFDEACSAISTLVQFHVATSTELDGVSELTPFALKLLALPNLSDANKAYLTNQLAMLNHGANKYEDALHWAEEALKFSPGEPSYHYNASIIFQKLKLQTKAVEHARQSLQLGEDPDADHIAYAYELFTNSGLLNEASDALSQLQQLDAPRALYLQESGRKKRK